MRTERGLDRLVFFTDAVTAIAITLLILPLVDAVTQTTGRTTTVEDFLRANLGQLGTFILSFVVIARLWISHHGLFEHVKVYSQRLVTIDLFWAFTIVLLPLPTAIITQFPTDRLTLGFYIGTMTLSSAALTAMAFMVRKSELESEENPLDSGRLFSSAAVTVEFAIALIVGVVFPVINFWALLVLVLGGPVEAIVAHRRAVRGRQTK
jgi:uncharacterized membrane protein